MFNKKILFLGILTTLGAVCQIQSVPYWNWSKIDVTSMSFPKNFRFGTTVFGKLLEGSSTQDEWLASEIGRGIEHTERWQEDIQLAKETGITHVTYILDWAKIEPFEGIFDEAVLQHYRNEFLEFHRNNIDVTVILKGLENDPSWYLNKGAFEISDNIDIFETYCLKVAETLKDTVHRYITFLAPESYAMLAYWNKSHPPFKKDMQLAMDVLANELDAHVRVYNALKKIDKNIQVGITKHVVQLHPKYLWDKLACSMANTLTNKTIYKFFTTGKLDVSIKLPKSWGGVSKHHYNPLAPSSLDFIGIDYHCHYQMRNFKRIPFENETKTEIPSLTIYPEGLYQAIREVSHKMARHLNIPIIINKNGIATQDDDLRRLYNERYLYAVSTAIKHGYNVQGYSYYSLFDACDWGSYDHHFGMYAVNRTTMERTLKPGASRFIEIAKKQREMYQ